MTAARVTACFTLGIAALLFVAGAAAERGASDDASALTNALLAARVERAIGDEAALTAARIDAEASAGVVTLRGSVPSSAGRSNALDVARSVTGVRAIRDELRVAGSQGETDTARF